MSQKNQSPHTFNETLGNGMQVILRPIHPDDAGRMISLFSRFSVETIHERFFEEIKEMTPEKVKFYVNVDGINNFALVAEVPGDDKLVGVARYMGTGNDAEFAIVIEDAWQGKGLGTLMFSRLLDIAKSNGLTKLFGYTLKNNADMIHIAEKTGHPYTLKDDDDQTLLIEIKL